MSEVSAHLSGGPLDGRVIGGQPFGKYLRVAGDTGCYVLVGVLDSDDELAYEWRDA